MEENTAHPGDHEAQLQALVLRLLAHPGNPYTQNPRLFVGQLPDALPVDLPLPDGSMLLGSLQRGTGQVEVVLDTPLSEQEVLASYRERLSAAGWHEEEPFQGMRQGGFVHTHFGGMGSTSCWFQGAHGPMLQVQALPGQGGRTDVRLSLDLSGRNSAQRFRMHQRQRMSHDFLPPLRPPSGATQMGGGGGGGGDSFYSSATLETADDLTTLTAHYAGQLEQAGWTRADGGQSGPVGWHSWTFQDEDGEPWRALFFILKMPEAEGHHFLYLKADWANKGGMMGGGFSFSRL